MTKSEFMAALASQLSGFPQHEVQKIFEYYEELFADGLESGKTEPEICATLENPRVIAERFRAELAFMQAGQKPTPKTINTVLLVLLGLFALPIGLPLVITLVALLFTAVAVVVSLIASGVAVMFALGAAGIGCLALGFHGLFTGTLLGGTMLIGASLILLGLGVIGTIGFMYLIRAVFRGLISIFHKIYQNISGRGYKRERGVRSHG